jgi:hypothetical protein
MRGRYAYSVASLSWIERKIASTLFATPPAATYEEALADFLEAEKFKPEGWLENRVFVARCYLALDNKEKIVEYLKLVKGMTPLDATEKELHVENDKLLKKYGN